MRSDRRVTSPVLIIGAGPYGVAIALELHRLQIPFVIYGELFSLWHKHTLTEASLRSDVHVSEVFTKDRRFRLDRHLHQTLPADEARRICAGRVPVHLFRSYLRHVETQLPFSVVNERIVQVSRENGGRFRAVSESGRVIHASQVVLACGIEAHQSMPDCLAKLGQDRVAHGWQVEKYEHVREQRVLVIGSGQSAAEAIAQLRTRNHVTWLHRSEPVYYADPIALPRPVFALAMRGSHIYSMLPQWLRVRLRHRMLGTTVTPDLKPQFATDQVASIRADVQSLNLQRDGHGLHSPTMKLRFDKVVACTGYRYRVRNLQLLDPSLRESILCNNDIPLLDRRFMTSVPGLYIVGAMAEIKHGPAMRFMCGTRTAAMLLGKALMRRAGRWNLS